MRTLVSELRAMWALSALMGVVLMPASTAWSQGTPPPPDFLVTVPSAYQFDETLERIRQAIEGENMMVVDEINPQQMLRIVGMRTRGMRQILFFHPRYMKQIIEANRDGAIEAPLKVVVMELPDDRVMVRYIDPTYQFGRYDGLEDVGRELKRAIEAVVGAVKP
jgi:uncharacterized protein (DUF302 family)